MAVRSRRSRNTVLVFVQVWIEHSMYILPSAIRLGAEDMFPRKQCGLFIGGLIGLVMLALQKIFVRGEPRSQSQFLNG
jgi:hypothetical protein